MSVLARGHWCQYRLLIVYTENETKMRCVEGTEVCAVAEYVGG